MGKLFVVIYVQINSIEKCFQNKDETKVNNRKYEIFGIVMKEIINFATYLLCLQPVTNLSDQSKQYPEIVIT